MAFSDQFASCMSGASIPVDASSVNVDGPTLQSVVSYLRQNIGNFGDYAAGLEAMTTPADTGAVVFSQSDVGAVDSSYEWLLSAFDQASGIPLTTALDWCDYCIQQASQAG
jgi:hypothetical protein